MTSCLSLSLNGKEPKKETEEELLLHLFILQTLITFGLGKALVGNLELNPVLPPSPRVPVTEVSPLRVLRTRKQEQEDGLDSKPALRNEMQASQVAF